MLFRLLTIITYNKPFNKDSKKYKKKIKNKDSTSCQIFILVNIISISNKNTFNIYLQLHIGKLHMSNPIGQVYQSFPYNSATENLKPTILWYKYADCQRLHKIYIKKKKKKSHKNNFNYMETISTIFSLSVTKNKMRWSLPLPSKTELYFKY